MKNRSKTTWLVYMHNNVNPDDDEVYKVYASGWVEARETALSCQEWGSRFHAGWALPYFPKKAEDRSFLKGFRWWATDKRKA